MIATCQCVRRVIGFDGAAGPVVLEPATPRPRRPLAVKCEPRPGSSTLVSVSLGSLLGPVAWCG